MKILYISAARIPSKTANSIHIMKMCQAFGNICDEAHLVAIKNEEIEENIFDYYNVKKNFEIHYLEESTFKYLFRLKNLLDTIKPDLVYGRFLHGCTLSSLLGYKTIYEVHEINFANTMFSKISFKILKVQNSFKKLVSITQALKNDILLKYNDLDNDKIIVLPDGADIPNTQNTTNKLKNFKTGILNIGYVGSMHQGKGVDIVVQLANKMPDFNFHIVGGKNDEIEFWKSKCKYKNIDFYGFIQQNELKNYISYLDVCLLPNQRDVLLEGKASSNIGKYTSPLKMFEYMSYKKAIVASDLEVIREVLNEENSILVKCDDISHWMDAFVTLKDDIIRNKIANKAYEDFRSKYTWDMRVDKIVESLNV